jgi:hypothetical protein
VLFEPGVDQLPPALLECADIGGATSRTLRFNVRGAIDHGWRVRRAPRVSAEQASEQFDRIVFGVDSAGRAAGDGT